VGAWPAGVASGWQQMLSTYIVETGVPPAEFTR